jgi:AraC-like DNA-binding protein
MDWRVSKLKEAIDSHAGGVNWSVGHACRELKLDISSAYAARLFRRDTGRGVREYAKGKRLLIAAERLSTTNRPIKVIAAELGYQETFAFSRAFEKRYHLSPTRFRNANRLSPMR